MHCSPRDLMSPPLDIPDAFAVDPHLDNALISAPGHADGDAQEAERALSDTAFRMMFKANPVPMWVFDAETLVVLAVNEAAVSLYGYTREQFKQMTIRDLRPAEDREALDVHLAQPRDVRTIRADGIWRHVTAGGDTLMVDVRSIPIVYNGRDAALVSLYDMTERLRIEQELRRERDRAEASDRTKEAFLSLISHEIRTPLNIILGYAGLIEEQQGAPSTTMTSYFDNMRAGCDRLMRTVDQMVSLSGLESGSTPTVLVPMHASLFLDDVLPRHRRLAQLHQLSFSMIARADAVCSIDRVLLMLALDNVLDNAVKFTPQGGITVTLDVADSMACISVTDTGIGIRSEYLPLIGTKYTQQESGRTRPYDGLGIGLAITRAIIDRHSGSLQIESTVGRGTTVRILLPILHT